MLYCGDRFTVASHQGTKKDIGTVIWGSKWSVIIFWPDGRSLHPTNLGFLHDTFISRMTCGHCHWPPNIDSLPPRCAAPLCSVHCGCADCTTTGCSTVRVSTLIAHISLMSGPIIKPFDSMKVKTVRIFLVYDMSSYWLYYPILGLKMFLTSFSQMWFLCAHRPNRRIKIVYALS